MMWTMQARMVEGSNSIRRVRKTSGRLQIAPVWPVSVVFSAASVYQSTGMGVVSVGEGQGTDRVDMGTG